jgi:hypothetical protein
MTLPTNAAGDSQLKKGLWEIRLRGTANRLAGLAYNDAQMALHSAVSVMGPANDGA